VTLDDVLRWIRARPQRDNAPCPLAPDHDAEVADVRRRQATLNERIAVMEARARAVRSVRGAEGSQPS